MSCQLRQFSQRYERTVIVKSVADYDDDWPSCNLLEFINWLEERVDSIPAAYKDVARIHIEPSESHEGTYANISVLYHRPETNDEVDERVLRDQEHRRSTERKEMELLEKLEAKYRTKNSCNNLAE